MGLSASLSIAQSALASAAAQSSVLSRNIANVSNPNFSRKIANIVTTLDGSSTVASVGRATNAALFTSALQAQSDASAHSAISDGLTKIQDTLGLNTTAASNTAATTATDRSPSTMIATLSNALERYASQPDTIANATAAVTAAKSLATTLNQASAAVQTVRQNADAGIASSVVSVNTLLGQFETVNKQIIVGTATGADVSDLRDQRDTILSQLSNQLGITTTENANSGMSIYTDSGVTLFDQGARTLTFTPIANYTAGTVGNTVSVDGVAITGAGSVMAVKSGALAGLTQLRDAVAPAYQNQLDQIAGALVATFAESGASGTSPALAGLFTNNGSSALPTSTTGLAAAIAVNASVDPTQGGNPTLLRDGNVSGGNAGSSTDYTYNTKGDAAYSGRLTALVGALGASRTFDAASGGVGNGSLATYAASSVSWLSSSYQSASNAATYQNSLLSTATTALSNATGVNLDDQMSQMLDIEHAYQASAQLLNTVSTMYSALISALH